MCLFATKGTAVQPYTVGDMPNLTNQYDSMRIAGVSLKWLPGIPNGAMATQYAPMAIVYDRDGIENDIMSQSLEQLMEQTNGTRILNMYRPWKKYFKTPKYRINTRIPSHQSTFPTTGIGYEPNENLAGQWKRVGQPLSSTFSSGTPVSRGTHLLVQLQSPLSGTVPNNTVLGTFVVTSYLVYKDRK